MELTKEKRRQWGRWAVGIAGFLVAWTVVAMVFPLLPSPWPPFYWALPVHGQVVDAETNTPLAGVIVAAHWELRTEGWSPRTTGQAAVMEDVTDIMGRFTFCWWRPRLRWPWQGYLESNSPGLLFFKSGYKSEFCHNSFAPPSFNLFPSSSCNGRIITLKKFQGTDTKYAEQVYRLDTGLEFAFRHDDCSWKKIPRMLVAMDQERKRFQEKGIIDPLGANPHSLDERSGQASERWCGSLKNYLRGYVQ